MIILNDHLALMKLRQKLNKQGRKQAKYRRKISKLLVVKPSDVKRLQKLQYKLEKAKRKWAKAKQKMQAIMQQSLDLVWSPLAKAPLVSQGVLPGGRQAPAPTLPLLALSIHPDHALVAIEEQPQQILLTIPLKSPPCKRCPALSGGICACAQKRLAKSYQPPEAA
ncbi:hypothetical protein VST7929_01220 [Vibrio stylophorae]|uniref:Uncharacterized protein n=1 Tax=Vibrio stylophorae TaxID=659351 RepID=A0ABM8ZST4_9VIBR|nr:hypothetical protein [Vibrio stylophorae]CAH0533354.1 hypothetical protein VST7929_01220 [Vibrio stylophorae]